MIEYVTDDIFKSKAEALVNPVNCVGVMGAGLAKEFKVRFPNNFELYKAACARGEVRPGRMFVTSSSIAARPVYIINFPTKKDWRDAAQIGDIERGMKNLVSIVRGLSITSIAIPALGCGLGGLDWENVRPLIEGAFPGPLLAKIEVTVYLPR